MTTEEHSFDFAAFSREVFGDPRERTRRASATLIPMSKIMESRGWIWPTVRILVEANFDFVNSDQRVDCLVCNLRWDTDHQPVAIIAVEYQPSARHEAVGICSRCIERPDLGMLVRNNLEAVFGLSPQDCLLIIREQRHA